MLLLLKTQIRSLVGELRSCKPHSTAKKRKRAKYHVGLSPHSQAEILPGEPSCDLRDSREVTVVLAELQEICPLEIAGNHCPGAGKAACRVVSPQ